MTFSNRTDSMKEQMVGMADLRVSHDPDLVLCSYPLGACLGIAIYDPTVKVGGLMHCMLPDSSIDPSRAGTRPGMFLDTGLELLLKNALDLKATGEGLLVYVAGGSEVLDDTSCFNIGRRNFDVLKGLLAQRGMKVHASDVGGLTNRTIRLNLATGEVRLKFSGQAKMKQLSANP